jgi:uncharacterized membrane protein
MATIKKLTKKDKFEMLLCIDEVIYNPTLKEFVEHEIELLEKKNSTEKKPTKTQKANEELKVAIAEGMEKGKLYTITELIKTIPECADLTNQKVSAVVRGMANIERVEQKGKAYFKVLAD